MKLYDGRGKRFKKLIGTKVIMKENRLKVTELIPKHARKKWHLLYLQFSLIIFLGMTLLAVLSNLFVYALIGEYHEEFYNMIYAGIFSGLFYGLLMALCSHRWTWQSKRVAIRVLAQQGFCPNCGYIIRETPADADGCTPCSECGYAWRVEPVDA